MKAEDGVTEEENFVAIFSFSSFKEASERAKVLVAKYNGEAVVRRNGNQWIVLGDWVLRQERSEEMTWVDIKIAAADD